MTLLQLRLGPTESVESSPADPVDLLLACHARIRSFTALSARLGDRPEADPAGIAEAAGSVARYFSVALPLHSTDEDLIILPRLARAGPPAEVREAAEEVSRQHLVIDAVLGRLMPQWRRVEAQPRALAQVGAGIADATAELDALWRVHLGLEEATLFPAIRACLAPETLADLVREMRARRA